MRLNLKSRCEYILLIFLEKKSEISSMFFYSFILSSPILPIIFYLCSFMFLGRQLDELSS